jgi:hypothetical protein
LLIGNFSDFQTLIEKLCSLIRGIKSLPEDDGLIVIHHLLHLISSILCFADNKLNEDVLYLFRTLLECFYEQISKSIKSKRILTFVSFLLNIIEKVKNFYSSSDKILFKSNEKGLLHELVNIMCNLIRQINPSMVNFLEILNIVNKTYEFLKICYDYNFPFQEVSNIFNSIFNSIDEFVKMNYSIEESVSNGIYNFFENILNMMHELSSLGLKEEMKSNMFADNNDAIRNERNRKLMLYINNFDRLFSSKNSDEIMKLKWYCCVSFGFLNKGKEIEKEFESIKILLKKYIEGEYSITDSKKIELTKIAYKCL